MYFVHFYRDSTKLMVTAAGLDDDYMHPLVKAGTKIKRTEKSGDQCNLKRCIYAYRHSNLHLNHK